MRPPRRRGITSGSGDREDRSRMFTGDRARARSTRRMPRQTRLERVMEEENSRADAPPPFSIGRAMEKIGAKGRFLVFAILIGAAITVYTVYQDRQAAQNTIAANYSNEAQVGLGSTLYMSNCAFCHGEKLDGKPGWDGDYPNGKRPPLPLDGTAPTWRLSDRDIFDVVKFGGQPFSPPSYRNEMPSFELQLSDADMWAIIAYMKSTWSEEVHERQRQAVEAQTQ